jgi:hypothetical protein
LGFVRSSVAGKSPVGQCEIRIEACGAIQDNSPHVGRFLVPAPESHAAMDQPADDITDQPAPFSTEPNYSTPKTIGMLNIIFASLLLLCGACYAVQMMFQQALSQAMMGPQQQQMQAAFAAERQAKIQQLEQQEKLAATKEQKAALESQRKALQAQPLPKVPDISKVINEPHLKFYFAADIASMLVLNVLMLISGIGLVQFKEWSRQMGIWVCGVKIVRLLVLSGAFVVVVVPVLVQLIVEMLEEMAAGGPAPPKEEIAGTLGIVYSVSSVGVALLGIIYPAIALWLLTRPSARAACAIPREASW